ncbi:hypothetical protein ACR3LR_08445 [Pantoea eucalypti]|uniref:hypothetical protein n=1 Tax=Pantoea eucalypti TaxID=470933 RepID=UPI003EE590A4
MTNEQKDNLTGLCKIEIKRWKEVSESNPNMRYMVELMEITLAALTAEPEYNTSYAEDINLDVSKAAYDRCHPDDRWISYPAPPVAAPAVPDGWKLVPVEPTQEMLDSQEHEMLPMVHHDSMRERARMIRRHGWRVMLAAAPEVE